MKKMLETLVAAAMVWSVATAPATAAKPVDPNTAAYLAELRDSFINSIGMRFVAIPAGSFAMGAPVTDPQAAADEQPRHTVTIAEPFYMGACEVTQAQWQAVMGENHSYFTGDNLPVEKVAWLEVQTFVQKLNARENTDRYALPTEAEWEYACRAGSNTRYYWGDEFVSTAAWNRNSSEGKTHPVGSLAPNAWGLYDMCGNVSEWVADIYAPYPGSEMAPPATDDRPTPVTRGGSWASHDEDLRSSNRSRLWEHYRLSLTGFRIKAKY